MALEIPHLISVSLKSSFADPQADELADSMRQLSIPVEKVKISRVFKIHKRLTQEELDQMGQVFIDPVVETAEETQEGFDWVLEICLKKGLTDNLGLTAQI